MSKAWTDDDLAAEMQHFVRRFTYADVTATARPGLGPLLTVTFAPGDVMTINLMSIIAARRTVPAEKTRMAELFAEKAISGRMTRLERAVFRIGMDKMTAADLGIAP